MTDKKAYMAAYCEAHREEARARSAEWYRTHRDQAKARQSAYNVTRRDQMKIYNADYRKKHAEHLKARAVESRRQHKEEMKQYLSGYRKAHRAERVAYDARNHDRIQALKAQHKLKYPELNRESAHRRRVRIRKGFVSPVSIQDIYKRDRGICQICRKPVDLKVVSLDHIIPVSHDGAHAPWNVQLSHRVCNLRRGPGRIPAQTRLEI